MIGDTIDSGYAVRITTQFVEKKEFWLKTANGNTNRPQVKIYSSYGRAWSVGNSKTAHLKKFPKKYGECEFKVFYVELEVTGFSTV